MASTIDRTRDPRENAPRVRPEVHPIPPRALDPDPALADPVRESPSAALTPGAPFTAPTTPTTPLGRAVPPGAAPLADPASADLVPTTRRGRHVWFVGAAIVIGVLAVLALWTTFSEPNATSPVAPNAPVTGTADGVTTPGTAPAQPSTTTP